MLIYPHFSRDQVFRLSLRRQSQDVTRLSVERGLAYVVESIVIPADSAAVFVVGVPGCCFYLTVQNTAHNLLPAVAARRLLNPVAFGSGWSEIDFCHHFGISFRILRTEQAVLANYLIRRLWGNRRSGFLHRLNDRVERHRPRGCSFLSDSDGTEQRDGRSGSQSSNQPPSPNAHVTCLAILRCRKHVLGQREKAVNRTITRKRNGKRANCAFCSRTFCLRGIP